MIRPVNAKRLRPITDFPDTGSIGSGTGVGVKTPLQRHNLTNMFPGFLLRPLLLLTPIAAIADQSQ